MKTKQPKQRKGTEGLMPDGSDFGFWGEDAVRGDLPGLPTLDLRDPEGIRARLADDAEKAETRAQRIEDATQPEDAPLPEEEDLAAEDGLDEEEDFEEDL